ncbi:ribonuclease P protein component [Patescibacteria group bacterium]|nr:ribonuclease P protein component [Patescibacteria group bacterium]MCL5010187.1 ribonuclease P protein component [Patescibacteria group bacterium]
MLKKKYRLSSRGAPLGRSFSSAFFSLKAGGNGLLYSRFVFAVSKKIDKRSVVRNRLRRIFSSIIQDIFDRIKPGYDMKFVIKREMAGKKRKEILPFVLSLLEKEGFLR